LRRRLGLAVVQLFDDAAFQQQVAERIGHAGFP
jgi:hypothetical protein